MIKITTGIITGVSGLNPLHACPTCPDEADGNDWDPYLGPIDEYGFYKVLPVSLPYQTGFEDDLPSFWQLINSNDFGRVDITTSNSPLRIFPYCGNKHMTMDVDSNRHYSTNSALLYVNLSNTNNVLLSFWWKEFNDEPHYGYDGVFFSDDGGSSFTQVDTLYGNNGEWELVQLDVTALATQHNLQLNNDFVIKFQHYDNYSIPTDGFAFDQISISNNSPDLKPIKCWVTPTSIQAGDPIYTSGVVYNPSIYNASTSTILKYYLSENKQFDYSLDIQLGQRVIPPLDAHARYSFKDTLSVTPSKAPDNKSYEDWYVLFYVDATNSVIESDELNNEHYSPISIDWGYKSDTTETATTHKSLNISIDKNTSKGLNNVLVYPNPANNWVTIKIEGSNFTKYTVEIKDIAARLRIVKTMEKPIIDIPVSSLGKGVYFIEIKGKNTLKAKLIIK